jgi:vacuolar-type H+-ATPase subunit H
MREISESANVTLSRLVDSLRDAGVGAQTLIGETANEAKKNAKSLVGEAMGECERLLRTAGELSAQANDIRSTLASAVAEVEKHLLNLPSLAQQEAQRVRDTVRSETEQMLDISARTISTLHARNAARNGLRPAPPGEPQPEAQPSDGLIGMARRLTQRSPKNKPAPQKASPDNGDGKSWNMRTLLAAVETEQSSDKDLKPGTAAALGALQAALADIAVDLDAIVGGEISGEEEWKQYLSGDRTIFARKLADSISTDTVERVSTLYRENTKFRDAANTYMAEFEALMAHAQEGDGGGLLTSSLLGADTGKIYLAVAYSLGRLS